MQKLKAQRSESWFFQLSQLRRILTLVLNEQTEVKKPAVSRLVVCSGLPNPPF